MGLRIFLAILLALWGLGQAQAAGLDNGLQQLKQEALELERDVLILEEQLENPLVIYFSMQAPRKFRLQSLHILIDGKPLKTLDYDSATRQALARGGAQRVYQGRLASGTHELIAYYSDHRDYQRGSKRQISKTLKPKFIEIVIQPQPGSESRAQPELVIREWDKF